MPAPNPPKSAPQFTTAEYSGTSGSDRCVSCGQPITARYVRGLLFGVGAAIIGMICYAGFTILTGFYIGYVSLAVGWLIGKAIMFGSRGIGGRRYQIAAVILTYAAVSLAAVPIAISDYVKAKSQSQSQSSQLKQKPPSTDATTGQSEEIQPTAKPAFGAAILQLLALGLASPFLALQDPFHGIIGLIILIVGIRIAWKITTGTRRADIQGPFENSSAAAV